MSPPYGWSFGSWSWQKFTHFLEVNFVSWFWSLHMVIWILFTELASSGPTQSISRYVHGALRCCLLCHPALQGARPLEATEMYSKSDVQQWCLKVTSKREVQKWCTKGMSKCDVQKWCPKVMSKSYVQKLRPKVMSKSDIQKWYPKVTSKSDTQKWRPKLYLNMSLLDITLGSHF